MTQRQQVHLNLTAAARHRVRRVKRLLGLPHMYDSEAFLTAMFWYWLALEHAEHRRAWGIDTAARPAPGGNANRAVSGTGVSGSRRLPPRTPLAVTVRPGKKGALTARGTIDDLGVESDARRADLGPARRALPEVLPAHRLG